MYIQNQIVKIAFLFCLSVSQSLPSVNADSRLLATGGALPLEGGAGGGITPWAVISGYGSTDEVSFTPIYTNVDTDDYSLDVLGTTLSFTNRIELSFARQELKLETLGDLIGQPNTELEQDIIGLKVRLLGDIIYTPWPHV